MQQGKPGTPIVYFLFDLLEVEGEPLIDLPLEERRGRLEAARSTRGTAVRLSETFDDGEALLKAAAAQRLEGHDGQEARTRGTSRASARATG